MKRTDGKDPNVPSHPIPWVADLIDRGLIHVPEPTEPAEPKRAIPATERIITTIEGDQS